jgi:hypothetical protein
MAEAEGKLKYKILQKRKIKYHSKKNCRSGRQNNTPKKITETERKYQIAEIEGKTKYQICKNRMEIAEIKGKIKYQIIEIEGKIKYQICRNWTNVTLKNIKRKLCLRLSLVP